MSNTLLPCPFCGGRARLMLEEEDSPDDSFHNIYCTVCGAQFWVKSKTEAVAAWNSRAGDDTNVATNADRIRSMSDEELAEWLVDANMCERVCIEEDYCGCDVCVNRVTDWLKQPAKEEHHEDD